MSKSYRTELQEAKRACSRCLNLCEEAMRSLNSARNWGVWDMAGGGMVSSLIKRSRMEDANEIIEELNDALDDLRDELDDVTMARPAKLDNSTGAYVLDVAFDNFFSDLFIQHNIKYTAEQLDLLHRDLKTCAVRIDRALASAS